MTGAQASTKLASRYQAALRWYPATWRDSNAEVLMGTLLDSAEADERTRPRAGELVNLAWSGLRERARQTVPVAVRNRAAAIALGLGTAMAAIEFFGLDWSVPWGGRIPGIGGQLGYHFGPFASAAVVVELSWLLAFVVTVVGLRRIGRMLLLVSVLSSAVLVPLVDREWAWGRPPTLALAAFAVLAGVACLGEPGRSARTVGWTAISVVVALVSQLIIWRRQLPFSIFAGARTFWIDFNVPVATLMLIALLVLFAIARRREWMAALLLAVGPWLLVVFCIRVANDGQYSQDGDLRLAAVGVAVLAVVAVIALLDIRVVVGGRTRHETRPAPPVD